MARDPTQLGVNFGTRLAAIMTRSKVASTAELLPHVRQAVGQAVGPIVESLRGADRVRVHEVLEANFGFSPLPEKTVNIVDGLYGIHPILATPILALALGASVFRLLGAAAEPFVVATSNSAFHSNPAHFLDPQTAAQAAVRGFISFEDGAEETLNAGFSAERWKVIAQLAQQRPQLTELFTLRNRGLLEDGGLRSGILALGFDDPTTRLMMELREVLPGPSDVVRFGVREAYRPDAIARGGLLQDLPQGAIDDAAKVGLSEESFRKYWIAHWELPSTTAAFEMFHRDVITEDELRGLLRTQDIAPGWRDELIAIAYNVVSRVDIRRMYREGIVSRQEVYDTYRSQGYSPKDAENLAAFAVADATTEARDLTKAEVVALYQDGAVDEQTATAMLSDLGYGDEETGWLLVLAKFQRFRRYRNLAVSRVRSRYVSRRLTSTEATTALDQLSVPTEEREQLLDLWDAERDAERPSLTYAFIGGLYRDGVIAEDEARVRWAQQGWRSDDIDMLVANYGEFPTADEDGGGKRRQLTKADIGKALREGTISVQEAVDKWRALGYTEADAEVLVANYLPNEET